MQGQKKNKNIRKCYSTQLFKYFIVTDVQEHRDIR